MSLNKAELYIQEELTHCHTELYSGIIKVLFVVIVRHFKTATKKKPKTYPGT